MVIFEHKRVSAGVFRAENLLSDCVHNRELAETLFDFCEACRNMSAIPQGAFAACKLRSYNKKDLTVSRMQSGSEKQEPKKYHHTKLMEYSPVKYNSKLMNSIWGLYNRYSPHNIKSNDDEFIGGQSYLQQPLAVAGYAITENLVMALESGKEWKLN